MSTCAHFTFCGKRMAEGDRKHGCNAVDQAACSPVMSIKGRTATAPDGAAAMRPLWLRLDDREPKL